MYGLQDSEPARVRIAELHRNATRVHMASQAAREVRAARQARAAGDPTRARRLWLVAATFLQSLSS